MTISKNKDLNRRCKIYSLSATISLTIRLIFAYYWRISNQKDCIEANSKLEPRKQNNLSNNCSKKDLLNKLTHKFN